MGGTQMFLTIGAILLLSLLVLSVNRTMIGNQDVELKSEAITTAVTVGQSMLNEISSKAFDEGILKLPVLDFLLITAPDSLGAEPGETRATYDDVDDYHNFAINDTTPRMGVFAAHATVNYVEDENYDLTAYTKTRTKLLKVEVFNNILKDTLKFYSYKCY